MARHFFLIVATSLLFLVPLVFSDDNVPIPADKSLINTWFNDNVKPLSQRKTTLDPALLAAEAAVKVVKVRKDGSGNFKTITEAVKSVPKGNKNRIIIHIGGGEYKEKIKLERDQHFVTFYGSPTNMPTLVFDGTAQQYGTVESGTLLVDGDYFMAANLIIKNSAPRPDGKRPGAQAAAMRIGGDKAAFYNCRFLGFQDTFCDDKGRHFFKDCYIEGTVDFIFGNGKSIYFNSEIHVIPGDPIAIITAHARKSEQEDTAYIFVHCRVTGSGKIALLGRAWFAYSRVIYIYSDLSDVVKPEGWHENTPGYEKTLFFGEYSNKGPGADLSKRVRYTRRMTDAEAKKFISLSYIEGSKWLLPPTSVNA